MPIRMVIIKESGDRCWRGCGKIGKLLYCWWKCKWSSTIVEDNVMIPQYLALEIPFDPGIPFLGIYLKDNKTFYYKDICACMFIVTLFTIANTWNQPKCPSKID